MSSALLTRYSLLNENFSKYWVIFLINTKNAYVYLSSVLIDFVVLYVKLLTLALIYKTTYQAAGAEKFGGLSVTQVVWILMFVQSLRLSRDVMSKIGESIKTGQIALFLNKPFSYPLFQYFSYLGITIVPGVINLIFGSLIVYILVGGISVNVLTLVMAVPLLFGAVTLIFLQSFIFGIIAFWVEEPDSFGRIYHKFDMVLGGWLIPIALFPEPLSSIALLLPWAQQLYTVGKNVVAPDYHQLLNAYLLQGFWIIFFALLSWWLFRKGLKNIVINGG